MRPQAPEREGGPRRGPRPKGGAGAEPPRRRSASTRGFTLLELLIAVALIALMAGIIGGVLRLASRAWEQGEHKIDVTQRQRDLVLLLAEELRSAYPYQVKDGLHRIYFFEGGPDRVQFVSALTEPGFAPRSGLRNVTISFDRRQGLSIQSAPLLGGGMPKKGEGRAQLLDEEVQDFQLRYLGPDGWVSSWKSKEVTAAATLQKKAARSVSTPKPEATIPRAVEMTVAIKGEARPFIVPLFAAVEMQKRNPAGGKSS